MILHTVEDKPKGSQWEKSRFTTALHPNCSISSDFSTHFTKAAWLQSTGISTPPPPARHSRARLRSRLLQSCQPCPACSRGRWAHNNVLSLALLPWHPDPQLRPSPCRARVHLSAEPAQRRAGRSTALHPLQYGVSQGPALWCSTRAHFFLCLALLHRA